MNRVKDILINLSSGSFPNSFQDLFVAFKPFLSGPPADLQLPMPLGDFMTYLAIFVKKAYLEFVAHEGIIIQLKAKLEGHTDLQTKSAKLISESEELKRYVNRKENDLDCLRQENKIIMDKTLKIEDDRKESEKKYKELNIKFQSLKQQNQQNEARIKQLEKTCGKKDDDTRSKIAVVIEDMERETIEAIKGFEEKIEAAGGEKAELQEQIKKLKEKNTSDLDVVRENERLVNDLKEKHEEEQHRWKMENEDLLRDVEDCHKLIESQKRHIEDLEGELVRYKSHLDEYEGSQEDGALGETFLKVELTMHQMQQMNKRVQKLSRVVQQLMAENTALKKELEAYGKLYLNKTR